VILYEFSKFQPKLKYYLTIYFYHSPETLSFLTDRPLVCRKHLRKIWRLAIGSPGRPAGTGGSIPAIAGGGIGRGGQGSGLGVLRDWFVGGLEVRRTGGAESTGGQWRRPPRPENSGEKWFVGARRQAGKQLQAQGRVIGVAVGKDHRLDPMLTVAASHGAGGLRGARRRAWRRASLHMGEGGLIGVAWTGKRG
jgi:hypothetical protein